MKELPANVVTSDAKEPPRICFEKLRDFLNAFDGMGQEIVCRGKVPGEHDPCWFFI